MYVFHLQIEGGILDTFEKSLIFLAGQTIMFAHYDVNIVRRAEKWDK